jgi:AcrR family transcriptional regulator
VRALRKSIDRVVQNVRTGEGLRRMQRGSTPPMRADEGARLLEELKRQAVGLFGGILPIGPDSVLQLLALESRLAGTQNDASGSARIIEMLLRLAEGVGNNSGFARVLRGAVIAFADRGYDETRIEDILAAGSVSPRTFYQFFKSKQEALAALSDLFLTVVVEVARKELVPTLTPEETLKRLARILVGGIALVERMAQIVIAEALRPGAALESLYERFRSEMGAIVAPAYGPEGDAAAMTEARVRLIAAMGATLELRLGRRSTPDELRRAEAIVYDILSPRRNGASAA